MDGGMHWWIHGLNHSILCGEDCHCLIPLITATPSPAGTLWGLQVFIGALASGIERKSIHCLVVWLSLKFHQGHCGCPLSSSHPCPTGCLTGLTGFVGPLLLPGPQPPGTCGPLGCCAGWSRKLTSWRALLPAPSCQDS